MKIFCLITLFIFTAADMGVSASETDFRTKQVRFIKELYAEGRYFDVIGETEKIYNAENKPELDFFIYSNYFLAGQYTTIIKNYNPAFVSEDMQFTSLLLLAGSYLKNGDYAASYDVLKKTGYDIIPGNYAFTLFLRRIEPLVLTGDSVEIDMEIARSELFQADSYNFTALREELQQYKREGLKSPGLSALMSAIIPGLGQCYSGYPFEGIISFLTVAAAAGGGAYLREKGHNRFSNTMFFFTGLFYGGNVYSAYNSAEVRNRELLQGRHRNIISKYGFYNPRDYVDTESVFR